MTIDQNEDLNLAHLQAELARIDILIRCEVARRLCVSDQDPNTTPEGLFSNRAAANMPSVMTFAAELLNGPWVTTVRYGATRLMPDEKDQRLPAIFRSRR